MAEGDRFVASIGPLYNVTLVVVGVSFTAVAWHNGLEIILTTLVTFTKYGTYFYSLIVAALGILCFQSAVFCMIFAPGSNGYGVIAAVDVGWYVEHLDSVGLIYDSLIRAHNAHLLAGYVWSPVSPWCSGAVSTSSVTATGSFEGSL